VQGLIDYDDISYDDHADLLYDLAGQIVKHLPSYLSEEEARNVLIYYQRQLVSSSTCKCRHSIERRQRGMTW
jgi:type III restriction enzyme